MTRVFIFFYFLFFRAIFINFFLVYLFGFSLSFFEFALVFVVHIFYLFYSVEFKCGRIFALRLWKSLNDRDTSTDSSKHGSNSRYLELDSNIIDVFLMRNITDLGNLTLNTETV